MLIPVPEVPRPGWRELGMAVQSGCGAVPPGLTAIRHQLPSVRNGCADERVAVRWRAGGPAVLVVCRVPGLSWGWWFSVGGELDGAVGCDQVAATVGAVPLVRAVGSASVAPAAGGLAAVMSPAQRGEIAWMRLTRWPALVDRHIRLDVVQV